MVQGKAPLGQAMSGTSPGGTSPGGKAQVAHQAARHQLAKHRRGWRDPRSRGFPSALARIPAIGGLAAGHPDLSAEQHTILSWLVLLADRIGPGDFETGDETWLRDGGWPCRKDR